MERDNMVRLLASPDDFMKRLKACNMCEFKSLVAEATVEIHSHPQVFLFSRFEKAKWDLIALLVANEVKPSAMPAYVETIGCFWRYYLGMPIN